MTKALLFKITRKDLEFQTFRSGGKGGQHQNKTDSGVRVIHRESGAVGESRTDRSQHTNRKLALQRLADSARFRLWAARKVIEISSGETIEQRVERLMSPENLAIEVVDEQGKWVKHAND